MSRRSARPALDIKVYRHFAVLTACVTTCIAVFADGENREFISDQLAAHQAHAQSVPSETRLKVNGLYVRSRKPPQAWGTVALVNDNQMLGSTSDNDDNSTGYGPASSQPPLPSSFIDGRPAAEVEAQDAAAGKTSTNCRSASASRSRCRNKPAGPSPEDIARAKEMSRERSGSSSSDDD